MSTLLITAALLAASKMEIETRTLLTGPKGAPDTDYLLMQRIVTKDEFALLTKTIGSDGGITYSTQRYMPNGIPITQRQEGQWNDRWNVLETGYSKNEAVQTINGEVTRSKIKGDEYRNPTLLWFWKTHPKIGEAVTVNFLAQNTIVTFQIKYTYEGDEKMTLAGREVTLHRVREDPLSAKGVYTQWWYDDQGMGVKRYHKTTQHEYFYDLISWR